MPSRPANILGQIRELLGLRPDASLAELTAPSPDALLRFTRRQLLDCADHLGLTGLTRLTKEGIAKRFQEALAALGVAAPASLRPRAQAAAGGTLPKRFEQDIPEDAKPPPAHIPWSYGYDRVTAIVVDPDRLYVYWEVTDEAITRARGALGPGGRDAWLDLRVYDVTGRLFDGTNAHGYVDQRVERSDRQWFFDVGRPTSTAVVEVGLRSHEGYFVRIARSGRADFPRREPAAPGGVEWLTVHTASGDVGPTVPGTAPAPAPEAPVFEPQAAWDVRQTAARADAARFGRETFDEVIESAADPIVRTLQWDGPVERLEWEAGPFDYPVASPIYVEERWAGPVTATSVDGRTHVIHGRWQVVIRGIGAHGERRVIARWELRRTWDTTARGETMAAAVPGTDGTLVGASERAMGASERRLMGASELRLGGASELWGMGASERRLGGASELLLAGASERRLGGASERTTGGASERRLGGASETSGAYPAPPAPKR